MTKNTAKRTHKSSTITSTTSQNHKSRGPPEPFTPAPPAILPFLSVLPSQHVYITHIDVFPTAFKKQIFAVPVALNLGITALLLWRLWVQLPWYFQLLMTVWGYESTTTVDTTKHSTTGLVWILAGRAAQFFIDFLLAKFIFPWPYTFFFEGGGNPLDWRLQVGFREKEIYVRQSRSFVAKDLLEATTRGRENPFFKVRILPAVDQTYLREKTGYLTMGADFDLDFGAMALAEKLVDKKEVPRELFERSVWLFCGESIGWARWDVNAEEGSVDDEEFLKALANQVSKERGEQ